MRSSIALATILTCLLDKSTERYCAGTTTCSIQELTSVRSVLVSGLLEAVHAMYCIEAAVVVLPTTEYAQSPVTTLRAFSLLMRTHSLLLHTKAASDDAATLLVTVPFATHTACTIEIANLTVDYDVAVIDEVQHATSRAQPARKAVFLLPTCWLYALVFSHTSIQVQAAYS
eukprot:16487-Heterococcus_DN1.PRE.1